MISNRKKRIIGVKVAKTEGLDYKKVYEVVKEIRDIPYYSEKGFENELRRKLRL